MTVQPAISAHSGCLTCGPRPTAMPLDTFVHPGFGSVDLLCDGELVQEFAEWTNRIVDEYSLDVGGSFMYPVFQGDQARLLEIEAAVADDAAHDWRLVIHGPFQKLTYQRHSERTWCLIASEDGFA